MRVGNFSRLTLAAAACAFVSCVQAATVYTSTQLTRDPTRKYLDVNNAHRILTMRQDSPAQADLHIVVEDWSDGGRNYSEFRPGTLPGTTRSIATAFNDAQQIVGYAETADENGNLYRPPGFVVPILPTRAFFYSNGVFTDLSALPPLNTPTLTQSVATGINEQGDVVGYWADANGTHAFLYHEGVITDLGALQASNTTRAVAINNARQVVGSSTVPHPNAGGALPRAFLYEQGTMQDLGLVPGAIYAQATAINDAGQVVGNTKTGTHSDECFVHANGTLQRLGVLGASGPPFCQVRQINNAGVAVGFSTATPMPPAFLIDSAFIWQDGQMTNLNSLVSPSDRLARDNIKLLDAIAINDAGEILAANVTFATNVPNATFYLLTPVDATADTAKFSFETGTQGWQSTAEPIVDVSTSDTRAFAGLSALAVKFNAAGFASVAVASPPVPAGRTVTFNVYLPADATLEWIQPFVLEGLDGGWRWSGNWQPVSALQLGAWNTLSVTVPSDASALWSLGVEFFAPEEYDGTVYVDSVRY